MSIQPALSAEEWVADTVQREAPNGDALVIVRDRSIKQEAGGHHHALAAIALHNQPFGFAREDLQALARIFDASYDGMGLYHWNDQADVDRLISIRERITALLPPE